MNLLDSSNSSLQRISVASRVAQSQVLRTALRCTGNSASVCRSLAPGCPRGPREGGRKPPRPRHCDRGRNPRVATGREVGKARGVGRSESQETCPDAFQKPVFAGGTGQVAVSLFILGGARSGKSRLALTGQ